MLKRTILSLCLIQTLVGVGVAQENPALSVDDFVICTAIEDRQPSGVDSVFSDSVERLYCFTNITGAMEATTIYHVWKFNDEEKAKIELTIGAKSWRTWSNKRIVKEWAGKWSVDVVTKDGKLLAKKEFLVKN